jgi:hypothetical protein
MPENDADDFALSLTPRQVATLERLADVALQSLQRADAALDQAFEEVEATRAYFAAKRGGAAPPGRQR